MVWLLKILFGPNVPENPHYEFIQDITTLTPAWYPHLVAGCMIVFLVLLWACRRGHTQSAIPAASARPKRRRGRTHGR